MKKKLLTLYILLLQNQSLCQAENQLQDPYFGWTDSDYTNEVYYIKEIYKFHIKHLILSITMYAYEPRTTN